MRASSRRGLWVGVGSLLLGGIALSTCRGNGTADTSPKNRIWIDRMPERAEEHRQLFILLEEEDESAALPADAEGVGIFQRASSFEGDYELFGFRETGNDRYELTMLQKKTKHRVIVRATKCTEKGFEFCLAVEGAPRGSTRYYSKRGWEIGSGDSVFEVTERARRIAAAEAD